MALKLAPEESLGLGIRRCALEQLSAATEGLNSATHAPEELVEAIHEARKACKKLRALLRLIRSSLAAEDFRRDNQFLRDVAQSLSGLRDTQVLWETAQALAVESRVQPAMKRISDHLADHISASASPNQVSAVSDSAAAAASRLSDFAKHVDDWPLDSGAGLELVSPGLAATYKRGRKLFRQVSTQPTDTTWHDWRKVSKHLFYQLNFLESVGKAEISPAIRSARQLEQLLGSDHDLVLLSTFLAEEGPGLIDQRDLRLIFESVTRQRLQLQTSALSIGGQLFARPKMDFVGAVLP